MIALEPTMMESLCARCNVCSFMPEQTGPRALEYVLDIPKRDSLVLVVDDYHDEVHESYRTAKELLGNVPFNLTSAIRCSYESLDVEQICRAASSCSVWTNTLIDNRKLIITTLLGLKQLKVTGEHGIGDVLKSSRLGMILVTPTLSLMNEKTIGIYKTKVQRVLRMVNL